jgi:hypothetical protein
MIRACGGNKPYTIFVGPKKSRTILKLPRYLSREDNKILIPHNQRDTDRFNYIFIYRKILMGVLRTQNKNINTVFFKIYL